MYLEIITPEEKVFEGEVIIATFPGTDGSFQVMNDHAALISTLKKGDIVYKDKEGEYDVTVSGGVVEVMNNKVIVLADKILKD